MKHPKALTDSWQGVSRYLLLSPSAVTCANLTFQYILDSFDIDTIFLL